MDDQHLNKEQSHPQSSHPSDVDSFVSRLRDDLLPGSEVEPDQENVKLILARIDYQKIIKIIGLLFGIAIITILVFKMGIFLSNNTRQITEKSSPTQ